MNEQTTHKLEFLSRPWDKNPEWNQFKIGTCDGLWKAENKAYQILAIYNEMPGNGHLIDVFEWFESSCKRDGYSLIILEVLNERFKSHLITERGFKVYNHTSLIKTP